MKFENHLRVSRRRPFGAPLTAPRSFETLSSICFITFSPNLSHLKLQKEFYISPETSAIASLLYEVRKPSPSRSSGPLRGATPGSSLIPRSILHSSQNFLQKSISSEGTETISESLVSAPWESQFTHIASVTNAAVFFL